MRGAASQSGRVWASALTLAAFSCLIIMGFESVIKRRRRRRRHRASSWLNRSLHIIRRARTVAQRDSPLCRLESPAATSSELGGVKCCLASRDTTSAGSSAALAKENLSGPFKGESTLQKPGETLEFTSSSSRAEPRTQTTTRLDIGADGEALSLVSRPLGYLVTCFSRSFAAALSRAREPARRRRPTAASVLLLSRSSCQMASCKAPVVRI